MAFEIMNAISRCQQPLRLDEITRGDGNCFPRAVVQQCRRPEVHENIENNKKSVQEISCHSEMQFVISC